MTGNHQWRRGRNGGVYLDERVENFRLATMASVDRRVNPQFQCGGTAALVLVFESPKWVTKKGTVYQQDVDNLIKGACDALTFAWNLPDELYWNVHAFKLQSERAGVRYFIFDLGNAVEKRVLSPGDKHEMGTSSSLTRKP